MNKGGSSTSDCIGRITMSRETQLLSAKHRRLIARHEADHVAANWLHKYGCRCQYGMDFYNANQMDALHQYKCGGRIAEIVFYGEAVYDESDMERADILAHIIPDRFERRKEKSVPNAATQGSGEGLRRTEKIMNRISELHEAKFNYLTKMFSKPEIRQKIEGLANALLEKDTLQC